MSKVLLVNTNLSGVYDKAKVKAVIPLLPSLALATLASGLIKNNHEVKVLDLNFFKDINASLLQDLESFQPDFVGITSTTATINQAMMLSDTVKNFNKEIITISGGAHTTYEPVGVLEKSKVDIAIIGEGDSSLIKIVNGKKLNGVNGIAFKNKQGLVKVNSACKPIKLDELPFPAWELFDIKKYKLPRLLSRKNPAGPIETSRGCVFGCSYCTKVFGRSFRAKSPERVVREFEYMQDCGFNEIHILDDGFSTDLNRAKEICRLIKARKFDIVWNLRNGIRANRLDHELANLLKEAGCYRVSIGVESGNQDVLNGIDKGESLEEIERAFKILKEAGLETMGFFMFGLPHDTRETMQQTIEFAKKLEPDFVKASICTPFPGTRLFTDLKVLGLIKTKDWPNYVTHNPRDVYTHPTLDWDTIYEYYNRFYKEFYLRPSYMLRTAIRGFKTGGIIDELSAFIKTKW